MTVQPTPSPGTPAQPIGALGNLVTAPTGGGSHKSNMQSQYGVDLPTTKVDGVDPNAVVTALVSASPQEIANTQRMLVLGGFYGVNSTYVPQYGSLSQQDLQAYAKALTTVADLQAHGNTDVSLGTYLAQRAQYGQVLGSSAAQAAQSKVYTISHPDPAESRNLLLNEFERQLGRKPTGDEMAKFAALVDAHTVAAQTAVIQKDQENRVKNAGGVAGDFSAALAEPGFNNPAPNIAPPQRTAATRNDPDFAAANHQADALSNPLTVGTPTKGGMTGQSVDTFMHAVAGVESGGNASSVNKDTGAAGTFQIMPGNWPTWAREAGLGSNAPMTPGNQELVARFKMNQYYQQFGSWQAVAVAWYAGPGAAAAWVRNPQATQFNSPQGNYPSINAYVSNVVANMGAGGTSNAPFLYSSPFTAGNSNPDQIVNYTAPNASADAIDYARTHHPVEAQAHDTATAFNNFLQLIGGPMVPTSGGGAAA